MREKKEKEKKKEDGEWGKRKSRSLYFLITEERYRADNSQISRKWFVFFFLSCFYHRLSFLEWLLLSEWIIVIVSLVEFIMRSICFRRWFRDFDLVSEVTDGKNAIFLFLCCSIQLSKTYCHCDQEDVTLIFRRV